MTTTIKNVKLANGVQMPLIGMGTLNLGSDAETIEAIKLAVRNGYRMIDCAWVYGNEEVVGRGIEEALAESKGSVRREDMFIISKVWNTHHSTAMAKQSCEETCKALRVDYVDLMLIHWPTGFKENTEHGKFPHDTTTGHVLDSGIHYMETYAALEQMQKDGKAKSIGVSNFNVSQLEHVLSKCTVPPVVNEIEVNPYFQNTRLVDFCQKNNINVIGYAPFGVGMNLSGRPDVPLIFKHPLLEKIGKNYNKSPAQVVLRYGVQRNVALIPRSCIQAEIEANANVFDFELSADEMESIKGLDLNLKSEIYHTFVNTPDGKYKHDKHPFYPFNE